MTICWPCHAHMPPIPGQPKTILPPYPASPCPLSLPLFLLSLFPFFCVTFAAPPRARARARAVNVIVLFALCSVIPPLFLVPVRRKVPPERIAVRHKLLYFIVQFLFIIFLGYFSRCVLLLMLHLLFRFSSDFFFSSHCCCCSCCCRALCGTCWQLELGPNWTKVGRHSHCRFVGNCFLKVKHTHTREKKSMRQRERDRQTAGKRFSYNNKSNKLELLNDDPQERQQQQKQNQQQQQQQLDPLFSCVSVCVCVLVLTIKKLLKYSECQRTITTQLFQQVAAMLNGVLGPGRRMPQATQGKGATRVIWGTYKWACVCVCLAYNYIFIRLAD